MCPRSPLGQAPDDIENLWLTEAPDPSVNSSFKLGTAAQTAIGLSALAAAHVYFVRTDSERYHTIDGKVSDHKMFDELSDIFKRKMTIPCSSICTAPSHKQGLLDILQCEPPKAAVASTQAVMVRRSGCPALRRHLCAAALRSFEAMDRTPHGIYQTNINPVSITKIGEAPTRRALGGDGDPVGAVAIQYALQVEGVRVLDLTRVFAGPVCGRTLADTETPRALVRDADVFLQAYRPHGLAGPKDCAALRPGIVHASLTGFSPWAMEDFDSLVQTLGGFNVQEAEAYADYVARRPERKKRPSCPRTARCPCKRWITPRVLLAFGIAAALCKTVTEGGAWRVHVSLSATLLWIRRFGNLHPLAAFCEGRPLPPRCDPEVVAQQEGGGQTSMSAIRHAASFTRGSGREWRRCEPEWLPRP
ncbi:CoA-transferase family III domain-containing protein [Russula vinacea]|nr:CoA-transferase family III domain-containing protein [Russula vinacea]